MSDEVRPTEQHNDEPQVFAVSRDTGGKLTFTRREFVKAASTAASTAAGAAALGITAAGTLSGCSGDNDKFASARAHTVAINTLAISQDGAWLASMDDGGISKVWSLPEGALFHTLEPSGSGGNKRLLRFNPDSSLLAAVFGDEIELWSLPEGQQLEFVNGNEFNPNALGAPHATDGTMYVSPTPTTFSPDGTWLAAAGDEAIYLWRLPISDAYDHYMWDGRSPIAFSPDGKLLASTSADKTIKVRSLPDGELLHTLEGHTNLIDTLVFSADGSLLVSGDWGSGGTLKLWSTSALKLQSMPNLVPLHQWDRSVMTLALNSDGTRLALSSTSGFHDIEVWSLPDETLLHTLKGHKDTVRTVAISPDSTLLASSSHDNTVKIWSLSDGKLLTTIKTSHPIAISPDWTLLAAGDEKGNIRLWSLPDGVFLTELIDLAASFESFKGVQYSPGDSGAAVVTRTCGSTIPAGATCICNCVEGSYCSCVGYSGGGSSGGGGHYWHPN